MPHMELKNAQQLLKKKEVDLLVAHTEDNVYYMSGYKDSMADWLPILAIVPADKVLAPSMIVNNYIEVQARQRTYIEDVRSYPTWMPIVDVDALVKGTLKPTEKPLQFNPEQVFSLFSDILKEKGLQKSIIGIEKSLFKNQEIYPLLTRQNPKARFVEADDILWELRKVKTEEEIKVIRASAEIALKGLRAVIKGGVLGASLGELHLRYKRGVIEAATADNAMELEKIRMSLSSGDHFGTMENAGYRVAKGDVIFIDNGVTVFGYTSDMGRTFSVGKPGEMPKRLFEALRAGFEEAVSMVKPGVKMKEIHRVVQETVRKKGFEWYTRGHMGHSVGIGRTEQPPFVSPNEETKLEPNMVICIENPVHPKNGRFGGLHIEDMFLITPEGHEVLTKLPRDMVEL